MSRITFPLLLTFALIALGSVPPTTAAAAPADDTTEIWNDGLVEELRVDVGPGVVHHSITVSRITATQWQISEADITKSLPPAVAPECVNLTAYQITCNVGAPDLVQRVVVLAGDGDDQILYNGGAVRGEIYGERGSDFLRSGGTGNDLLVGDYTGGDRPGDGSDALVGGCGVDEYVGGGGVDAVSFLSDPCPAHQLGVSASLDEQANDPDGENIGGPSNSIENIHGTNGNDNLTGSDLPNEIYGNDGDDSVRGLGGADVLHGNGGGDVIIGGAGGDELYGEDDVPSPDSNPGADTLEARDGETDAVLRCGEGPDVANVDAEAVETPHSSCETVNRPPAGGGGSGGSGGTSGGGTTPGGGGPTVNAEGVVVTGAVDTTKRIPFPNVVGSPLGVALNTIYAHGINANPTYKYQYKRKRDLPNGGAGWLENDVISTTAPKEVVVGAGTSHSFTIVLWGGPTKESCLEDAQEFAGLPFDELMGAMTTRGCKLDQVDVQLVKSTKAAKETDLNSGDRCEAGKKVLADGNGRIDPSIQVPLGLDQQDLRLYRVESGKSASLQASNGGLRANQFRTKNQAFRIAVGSRHYGDLMNGAIVFVDATAVGGEMQRLVTGVNGTSPGTVTVSTTAMKPGNIDIVAIWGDSKGSYICGATRVPVFGPVLKPGQYVDTQMGRRWYLHDDGKFRRTTPRSADGHTATATADVHVARAGRADLPGWVQAIISLFTGKRPDVVQTAQGGGAPAMERVNEDLRAAIAIINTGSGNPVAISTPQLAQAVPIVAQGAGNIVATGGGNIVATGGGNIVAQGGGNIVAQGGGNVLGFDDKAGIVAQGGGNIVATGGGNIVAQGGGNIVSVGGVGIVAQGGGNLIAAGSGAIVASGGGN